jgi:hypothetical protein
MKKADLDFGFLYSVFKKRILNDLDCGQYICGDSACCFPAKTGSFINFLPGEFKFLQKRFGKNLPFLRLKNGRYHCRGNRLCLGDFRPIDCRSYPLWPLVFKRQFVGFVDCRGRRCPLKAIPPKFQEHAKNGWEFIFKTPGMLEWVEKNTYTNGPLIIFPEYKDKKAVNEIENRVRPSKWVTILKYK